MYMRVYYTHTHTHTHTHIHTHTHPHPHTHLLAHALLGEEFCTRVIFLAAARIDCCLVVLSRVLIATVSVVLSSYVKRDL